MKSISKSKNSRIKYLVNGAFFDDQKQAERYALFMTNPVSSKVWINVVVFYKDDEYYCVKSYTI